MGQLDLFYPLLISSVLTFLFAFAVKSWVWMLISGLLIFPNAWYFSGYPAYGFVILLPIIHVMFAIVFYRYRIKKNSIDY
ncbi:membrane protein YdbS with pleckstrin-like domain [Salirhabdus euzebyi]|uniref:Membrane protein YdbS with pleckstrin-like domain n=1 Tax=Salirhabdus euzebyi TaxID=394506 RepID=A0A841PZE5_9BACI|nr:membrane protein YdbS with pleckstrin-like domain [Salirhabdus euzebyi]